jgi:hypothetical protein
MHRELIATYALFIGCLLVHRKLYSIFFIPQLIVVGSPMSEYALVLMGVNSVMFSALTMLWFVNKTDKLLKK